MGRKCKVCELIENGKNIDGIRKGERLTYRKMAVAIKRRFNVDVHFSNIARHYRDKHEAKPKYRPPPKPLKKNMGFVAGSYGPEIFGRGKQKHSKWWKQHIGERTYSES